VVIRSHKIDKEQTIHQWTKEKEHKDKHRSPKQYIEN
jgi:hypothetical protein